MRFATTIVGVVLLATITLAQSINYDFDKTANFAAFRTYAWIPGASAPDRLNNERIISAINSQLVLKRLKETDRRENPDLLVAYHAAFDRDVQITGFSNGWGGFRYPASGTARANAIITGTLIVDLVDARTRTVVWRGIVAKDIDPNDKPEQRDKNINRAAAKLFKNYPPQAK